MPGIALISRVSKIISKPITFTGAANLGAIGSVTIFTVTGMVRILSLGIQCLTTLVGTSATIALGYTGNTSGLIAATTATNITNVGGILPLIWQSISPATGGTSTVLGPAYCNANIICTIAVANVTAGALEFDLVWERLSPSGNIQ